jgi:hypothetical protein
VACGRHPGPGLDARSDLFQAVAASQSLVEMSSSDFGVLVDLSRVTAARVAIEA